jgi:hypothetical protein
LSKSFYIKTTVFIDSLKYLVILCLNSLILNPVNEVFFMQATIDIRIANTQKMKDRKFDRLLEIVEEELAKEFPKAIVRARKSASMSDVSVFGLGKEGKKEVSEFLEALFNDGSAFDELNDQYY